MMRWLQRTMAGPLAVVDAQSLITRIRDSNNVVETAILTDRLKAALVLGVEEPTWLSDAERAVFVDLTVLTARKESEKEYRNALLR